MMTAKEKRMLIFCGIGGLLGALGVGMGEWLMQYTPESHLDGAYAYFAEIPRWRLSLGHFLCVLTGPLYFLGYLHLGRMIDRSRGVLGKAFTALGIYAFGVGIAWIGGRIYLALAKQGILLGQSSPELLDALAAHNEPFIQVLRLAMLALSALWIYAILSGRSHYPKWMAVFSPIALLVMIFLSYVFAPAVGKFILPTAMNLTHFVIFSLSLLQARRLGTALQTPS